jgi:hypothetical protein
LGFGAKLGKRRISIIPHVQTSPSLDYSLRVDATAAAMARTLGAGLSLIVVLCMGLSLLIHRGIWPIERMALMIVFPALLGITLAFAPDPPALVSRLAKRLTVAGCAIGTLAGPWLAPTILAVPALLAFSVAIGWFCEDRHNG